MLLSSGREPGGQANLIKRESYRQPSSPSPENNRLSNLSRYRPTQTK